MSLETLSETQNRLATHGFVDDLVADHGRLRSAGTNQLHALDELAVLETVRYEGDSDPGDEAILIAVSTRHGEPVGTFTVPDGSETSSEQSDILERLPRLFIDDHRSHTGHDHIAAVFPDSASATAAVDALRTLGLGSEHLGLAVRTDDRTVFEHDAEKHLANATLGGIATGTIVGYLAGFALVSVVVPSLAVGGVAALAIGAAVGGAMLGGYTGASTATADFSRHDSLGRTPLATGEVLVIACSQQRGEEVRGALQGHGGRLNVDC